MITDSMIVHLAFAHNPTAVQRVKQRLLNLCKSDRARELVELASSGNDSDEYNKFKELANRNKI